jgi:hypothetical protein
MPMSLTLIGQRDDPRAPGGMTVASMWPRCGRLDRQPADSMRRTDR